MLNQGYRTTERAKLRGQVEDDAKLDHLDIEDVVAYHFSAGGSAVGRHVLLEATIARTTRVNMRTPNGTYVPSEAAVRMLLRINGRSVGPEEELQNATTLAEQFKQDFANLVQRVIRNYRSLETGWNRSERLRQDRLLASLRGPAPVARPDGHGHRDGFCTGGRRAPERPLDHQRPGQCDLHARAGEGEPVRAVVHGLELGAGAPGPRRLPGHLARRRGRGPLDRADQRAPQSDQRQLAQRRPERRPPLRRHLQRDLPEGAASSSPNIKGEYELTSGTGTWQVSGTEGGCNVSGSGPFSVGGGAVLLTTPGSATPGPPFSYLMQTQSPQNPGTAIYIYSGCDDAGDDGPREMPIPFSGLNISGTTPDGFAYNGSRTESSPPDHSSEETWSFTGTS